MTNEEALEILDHNWTRLVNSDYTDIELGQAHDLAIKALKRPTGKWIVDEEHSITMTFYKCTNCNYFGGATHYLYCPHCGADMRGGSQ